MSRPVILAQAHEDGVKLSPQSYLGTLFGAYREAVVRAGARYVAGLKANVLAVDRLPLVQEAWTPVVESLTRAPGIRHFPDRPILVPPKPIHGEHGQRAGGRTRKFIEFYDRLAQEEPDRLVTDPLGGDRLT